MPWGTIWGTSWGAGLGSAGSFFVVRARAVSSRAVRVTFSTAPSFGSPIGVHDAANLANWTIENLDTGALLELLATRGVLGDPLSVEIITNTPFVSPLVTYEVTAVDIQSDAGASLTIPDSATFPGMPAVLELQQAAPPLVDLYNPQSSPNRLNGSLIVGTDGDYTLESGGSLLKKLIYRRLLTAVGEYYHLADQNYGLGLEAKQMIRPGDLANLRTRILAQVTQEPEVAAADVSLELKSNGRLTVGTKLQVKRTGQQVSFTFPIQF